MSEGADRPRRAFALPPLLVAYASAAGVLGVLLVVVVVVLTPPLGELVAHPLPLAALAIALVVGELTPVPVTRGDNTISPVTISTTFAVALLVLGPLSFALLVHALAVALDDRRSKRPPLKCLFNLGQYSISLVVARCVFSAVSGTGVLSGFTPFSGQALLASLAAGAAFVLTNDSLVSVIAALATGQRIRVVLLDDLRFKLETSGVLVALGPIAALLVDVSVLMLPLLLLPALAVRRTALLAALREQQSLHDPLTGLANRALFNQRVERAIAGQVKQGFAVLMLDLDHFKDVNDVLGHHVGDELLCEIARRTARAAATAGSDVEVARLGGDEFAVLLVAANPRRAAEDLAQRLLESFTAAVDVAGTRLMVGGSIGIASTDAGLFDGGHSALQQADIALYHAKEERARASVFDASRMGSSDDRLRLLPQLREGIDKGQLTVLYQPQVDVRDGRVTSVEALVRWDHPVLGRLGPDAFIDFAEGAGLIARITTHVLRDALDAWTQWRAAGYDLAVAVNLSARQLSDRGLPAYVADLLDAAGAPGSALIIEVTESSLMADPRAARIILRGLRDMGVRLAIDDFGTGYSSLVLLQQLAVDELKIDRSFVTALLPGGHDEILVRSIIDLGHNLGLRIVGEGVETSDVARLLESLGCDRLQGHVFGAAMERASIEAMLAAGPVRPSEQSALASGDLSHPPATGAEPSTVALLDRAR